jgi:hypothetical protein
MISIVNQKSVSDGRIYADVFGTSQDTKPTGIFCTGIAAGTHTNKNTYAKFTEIG